MKVLLAGISLVLLASPAAAADGNSGWYMGVGAGPSGIHSVCSTVEAATPLDSCDDESVAWKVFVGRTSSKYWGIEFSYVDAGEANVTASPSAGTLVVNPRTLTAYGTLDIPLGDRFGIFGKAGLSYFNTTYERTGVFRALPSGDDGLEGALGAGFRIRILKDIGVRFEWEHFNDAVGIGSGDVDTSMVSLMYRF